MARPYYDRGITNRGGSTYTTSGGSSSTGGGNGNTRMYNNDPNQRYDKYAYISSLATPQQYQSVYQKYGIVPNNNQGYGGGYDGGGYDYASALRAQWDDWLNEMNAFYKTQYDQELKNTRTQFEKTRDPLNNNYKRNEKMIRAMLGPDSGRGVGLLSGNNADWANKLADARNWMGNQNANSLATYHKNLADTKRIYAEKMASLM